MSLAAVLDGMSRTDAARVGGMDRQAPRDWVHRFSDFDISRNIVYFRRSRRYIGAMDINHAARCLETLGNPTRLEVYRLLVRAGPEGLAVGEIQGHLGVPASTLSHHISHLVNAGLVDRTREGRVLRCTPNYQRMERLLAFLSEECCQGVAAPPRPLKAG